MTKQLTALERDALHWATQAISDAFGVAYASVCATSVSIQSIYDDDHKKRVVITGDLCGTPYVALATYGRHSSARGAVWVTPGHAHQDAWELETIHVRFGAREKDVAAQEITDYHARVISA